MSSKIYRIELLPTAVKSLEALGREAQRRIRRAVDDLSMEPRPMGVSRLKGVKDVLRIRVGDYRILYRIDEGQITILVIAIAHRRNVYRKR